MTTLPHWLIDAFIFVIGVLALLKARDDLKCGQRFAMVLDAIIGVVALFVVFGMSWK